MKGNKGFSLVEIVVVIAIMGVLVGVIAPQLIRYFEKANVSADTQLCDSVRSACILMLSDPEFVANDGLDAQSKTLITQLTTPGASGSFALYSVAGTNFQSYEFLNEITGINVFTPVSGEYFKSSPAKVNGILCYKVSDEGVLYIFINHSDNSGSKTDYQFSGASGTIDELSNLICVPIVN